MGVKLRSMGPLSWWPPPMRATQPRARRGGELEDHLRPDALEGAQDHGGGPGQGGDVVVVGLHDHRFDGDGGLDPDFGGELGSPLAGEGLEPYFENAGVLAGEGGVAAEVVELDRLLG